jgi:hypothetical protein
MSFSTLQWLVIKPPSEFTRVKETFFGRHSNELEKTMKGWAKVGWRHI